MAHTFNVETNASIEQERQGEANGKLAAKKEMAPEEEHSAKSEAEMDGDSSKKLTGPNRPSI